MAGMCLQSAATKKAAVVSGVNVKLTEFMVYVICGFCAAFAGLLLSSRIQTGQPAGGEGYELDEIWGR